METEKITYDGLVSATVKFTNKDNAERTFGISANVTVQDKEVTQVYDGQLTKDNQQVGNFSMGKGTDWCNLSFNGLTHEEISEATDEIIAFAQDVAKKVKEEKFNI